MELSIRELDLASATVPIPENGPDPYRMIQVHDYLNVSFLRMDPSIRAATKETIQKFQMAYPELLKEKFFVNVPLVMGCECFPSMSLVANLVPGL
jgi:phosphatidylinositol transfer protein SFH5